MQYCLRDIAGSDAQILSDSFENNDRYAYIHRTTVTYIVNITEKSCRR